MTLGARLSEHLVALPPKRDIYAGFDAARLAALTLYAEPYDGSYVRVSAAFSLARGLSTGRS